MMILPGGTLGMLGGGQLGRMFTVAARTMGYNVIVLDPDKESPAGAMATDHICADYTDTSALHYFAKTCDAVSTEFENVPAQSLEWLTQHCVVRPGARAVSITQDRITEKTFLRDAGFPTAPFAVIRNVTDLQAAIKIIGTPAILKVSRFGYDGKGQVAIDSASTATTAFDSLKQESCVLEARLQLQTEISVVVARGHDSQKLTYPVAENQHADGILDISIVPARVSDSLQRQASDMACAIADKLEYVGVMAVEFFVVAGDRLIVNEIAPRPHNSGHYTIDACVTNQFEQQVRALCGLPLGDTRLLSPAVMVNLLGDLWRDGHPPKWEKLLNHANIKLHLYGKHEARKGRKMGHYCILDENLSLAVNIALQLRSDMRYAADSIG